MLKIVGIGDNVVDRYLYKKKMYPGGNAVNVPVLAHKTGRAEAAYIGTVGTDYAGSHIVDSLKREGLDVSHVKIKEGEMCIRDRTGAAPGARGEGSGAGQLPDRHGPERPAHGPRRRAGRGHLGGAEYQRGQERAL